MFWSFHTTQRMIARKVCQKQNDISHPISTALLISTLSGLSCIVFNCLIETQTIKAKHHIQHPWDAAQSHMQRSTSFCTLSWHQEHQVFWCVTELLKNLHLFVVGIRYRSCQRNTFFAGNLYGAQVTCHVHFRRDCVCNLILPLRKCTMCSCLIRSLQDSQLRMAVSSRQLYYEYILLALFHGPRCKCELIIFGLGTRMRLREGIHVVIGTRKWPVNLNARTRSLLFIKGRRMSERWLAWTLFFSLPSVRSCNLSRCSILGESLRLSVKALNAASQRGGAPWCIASF